MNSDSKTNIDYWEHVLQSPTPAYAELFKAEQQYLLNNIPANAKVLDIGCGEGRNMMTIYQKTPFVFGIDHDQKAVDNALKNFINKETVTIIKAEANKLPFKDESFDVITFLIILPNLEGNKEYFFREVSRVLKNDGRLILSTFSETAFDERMKIYKQVNVPIINIEGTKVIFDKSVGANTSEQFSKEELIILGQSTGFTMVDCEKVGKLAYICTYIKN